MLSIVTSVYGTAGFLEEFVARMDGTANSCGLGDYEMLFVIDGSCDDAAGILRNLKAANPRLRIIELSRNFGHHAALLCGLEHARGDLIFLADSDLETPPEVLRELHAALADPEADVAFACRRERREPQLRRFAARLFWRMFDALADVRIHPDPLTERLMRRRPVDAVLSMGDRTLFLAGMLQWVGFRQVPVPVETTRRRGSPSYSWIRRAALAFDAIASFSTVPMTLLFIAGLALAAAALAAATVLIGIKIFRPDSVMHGFAAAAVLILFSLGSILAAIGMLGLYLGKIFLQTKARPIYIVRDEF